MNGEKAEEFLIESPYPIFLNLPGKIRRSYEGEILIRVKQGRLFIINRLPLSAYLSSVILSEMGHAPLEALKAQAVLSRTLAYTAMAENKNQDYDVSDLTDSQAYRGFEIQTALSRKAVETTEGLILTYQNRRAKIFYASTCGGHTSSPHEVWGQENRGLKGVACSKNGHILCRNSPHFKIWQWKVALNDLTRLPALKDFPVDHIEISKKDSWGRVLTLDFFSGEQKRTLLAEQFRIEAGRHFKSFGLLKSAYLKLAVENQTVLFEGRGLGHGVGLCQWGAKTLADMGLDFKAILQFYFPALKLKNREETH